MMKSRNILTMTLAAMAGMMSYARTLDTLIKLYRNMRRNRQKHEDFLRDGNS